MKRKYVAIAVVLLIIGMFTGGCGKTALISVKTVVAQNGNMNLTYDISGVLTPNHTVNIASKLSGQVLSVPFDIGSNVKAGQLLVQLDTKELGTQLQSAQASVQGVRDQAGQAEIAITAAKSNLDLAQKTYDRVKNLFENGAASQSQLDDANNKLQQAQSALQNAQSGYQTAAGSGLAKANSAAQLYQEEISDSSIYSPINGKIVIRNINPGEMAAAGTPLLTVQDTAIVKLQAEVPQELIPLLSIGQKLQVNIDAFPGQRFDAEITRLGPAATATGQYFPVVISINNAAAKLMTGMTGKASLQGSVSGIIVPMAAVSKDNGRDYVYVIKNGKATRQAVTLGKHNASQIQIISGITSGDAVAVANINILHDGMKIKE